MSGLAFFVGEGMKMSVLQDHLTEWFQTIHQHPELGMQEFRTTELVKQVLNTHGIRQLALPLETGAIAVLGHDGGPTIGLRCDMDALPIEENTGLPYASRTHGVMHACGHDFHTAVMLGVALCLKARESALAGKVKIVFQPAEETTQGAFAITRTGLVDDCNLFLGLHTYPGFQPGTLGIKSGPVMAAVDWFSIRLHGRGSHAAQPQKGIDPIPAACATVTALQTLASRFSNPFSPVLCSVTRIEGGTARNVIPESCLLEGTVRTMDPQVRSEIREHFMRLVTETARAYAVKAEIDWSSGPPALINDPSLCTLARTIAQQQGLSVDIQEDTLGGEDFSEYLVYPSVRPGLFVRIGTGGNYPQHHPRFTADPSALESAVHFFTSMAEACLAKA